MYMLISSIHKYKGRLISLITAAVNTDIKPPSQHKIDSKSYYKYIQRTKSQTKRQFILQQTDFKSSYRYVRIKTETKTTAQTEEGYKGIK